MHSFQPICTLPPEGTNFVGSPPTRGTLQILWSCLSVLILCTWTLLHLNVPPQTTAITMWQKLRRATTRSLAKFRWMLFNVLAPEWIFTKACLDWISVYKCKTELTEQARADGVPWTNTHTHFANMGGFGISFQGLPQEDRRLDAVTQMTETSNSPKDSNPPSDLKDSDYQSLNSLAWTNWVQQIHRTFTSSAAADALRYTERIYSTSIPRTKGLGLQVDSHNSEKILRLFESQEIKEFEHLKSLSDNVVMNLLLLRANLWILDAPQLLKARKLGIIDSLPDIKEDDLGDRSKGNVFIKLLALGQTSWFIIQFLVRFHFKQPNTQLEVMVVAFSVCSVATYVLLWDRPKEVEYTVMLKASKYPSTGANMFEIAIVGPHYWRRAWRRSIWMTNTSMHQTQNFSTMQAPALSGLIICVVMLVFGAIHCVAWNFDFPTRVEQNMWRASSLATALVPLLVILDALLIIILDRIDSSGRREWLEVIAFGLAIFTIPMLFIAARLFILVEVFRALFFQPPGAFDTTWLSNLPHFG